MIPYPPIFSKRPARTIDPSVGARTWASGNQRCSGKLGSFTIKPNRMTRKVNRKIGLVGSNFTVCMMTRRSNEPIGVPL